MKFAFTPEGDNSMQYEFAYKTTGIQRNNSTDSKISSFWVSDSIGE